MQQNRIIWKSVETKTKMLEHPWSFPPIANCPTRSRTEERPCWLGCGLHCNRDEFTLWWQSSILDYLVRCRQLGCSTCLLLLLLLCSVAYILCLWLCV